VKTPLAVKTPLVVPEFSELTLVFANGVGVVGVVLLVGWLVWTGRLIPKATHDREIAYLERRIEDEQHHTGEWRTEARLNQQAVVELNDQNTKMLAGFDALADFLRSLRRAASVPPPVVAAAEAEGGES
jgi:hypothetical protein